MNNKTVIIQGSARSDGNSTKVSQYLMEEFNFDVVDLNRLRINPFEYDNKNSTDDFMPTIKNVIENYHNLIFLSPVYWYTMSGQLKIFLDRFTDLLKWEKETGRKLRSKSLGIISNSNDNDVSDVFEDPIRASAQYLGMNYIGHCHVWLHNDEIVTDAKMNLNDYCNNFKSFADF